MSSSEQFLGGRSSRIMKLQSPGSLFVQLWTNPSRQKQLSGRTCCPGILASKNSSSRPGNKTAWPAVQCPLPMTGYLLQQGVKGSVTSGSEPPPLWFRHPPARGLSLCAFYPRNFALLLVFAVLLWGFSRWLLIVQHWVLSPAGYLLEPKWLRLSTQRFCNAISCSSGVWCISPRIIITKNQVSEKLQVTAAHHSKPSYALNNVPYSTLPIGGSGTTSGGSWSVYQNPS